NDLFGPEAAERLRNGYVQVLETMADAPDSLLGELDLLTDLERGRLQGWGAPSLAALPDAQPVLSLHQRVEHQAQQRPQATALVL
ncbi:hypothetical protein, partial [Paracidovorax valerianellae]